MAALEWWLVRARRWPAALGIVLLLSVVGVAGWTFFRGSGPASEQAVEDAADEPRTHVVLSPARLSATHLRSEPCRLRLMPEVRVVPGRLTYDESRHVTVRVPVEGLVREIRVKPGDSVAAGDVIAVVSSPGVGTSRADVLQREAELALALRRSEWEAQVTANVESLVRAIEEKPELAALERSFDKKVLGDYRERVLAAYSRFVLAEALSSQLQPLADRGIAEGRVVRERTSNRQVTDAALRSACEQAVFDARQKRESSRSAAEDAQRRLQVSRNHLATLLGREEPQIATDPAALSLLEIRAPITGTVEDRLVASAERVNAGEAMFVVADATQLWVTADIRERDWDVMSLKAGASVEVQIPALANRSFPAQVLYVGRTLNETSHALPLVAVIGNSERLLRPGLFARVTIPVGLAGSEVLAIPTAAVMDQDGRRIVFVEEKPGSYRQAEVQTGRQNETWTEVREGLAAGEKVVVEGGFVLKSELLLEAED